MSHSATTCNIPFSVSEGSVMEGRMFSLRCIDPPTVQVFLNGQGFVCSSTENRWKEKQFRRISGTNQNICFVKFTFTDCLVEFSLLENSTLTQITPGNRLRFTSQKIKVHFDSNKGAVSVTKSYNKPTVTFVF